MAAVWLKVRADVRRNARAVVALILIVGLGAGVALAAIAGARRTGSAYDRFLVATNADDVVLAEGEPGAGFNYELDLDTVAAFPEVEAYHFMNIFFLEFETEEGLSERISWALQVSQDPVGGPVNESVILEGRRKDPAAVEEVEVGFSFAQQFGIEVGETLTIRLFDRALLTDLNQLVRSEPVIEVEADVVGVVARNGTFPPKEIFWQVFATEAFREAYADRAATVQGIEARLRGGDEAIASFKGRVDELAGGAQQLVQQAETTAGVQRSIRVSVVALAMFGALLGLAIVLIGIQTLARLIFVAADDADALRALGFSRRSLFASSLLFATTVTAAAIGIALITAAGLSPLMPQGVARIAEPDPGFSFDVLVLVGGSLAVAIVFTLGSVLPAARTMTSRRVIGARVRRPSRLVGVLASTGAAPSAVSGTRLALERGHGRNATPLLTTIAASAIGIAALVTAVGFDASLDHLLDEPRLSGWNWDVMIGNIYGPDTSEQFRPAFENSPAVGAFSGGTTNLRITLESETAPPRSTNAFALDLTDGEVTPTVVEGAWPRARDEIALGTGTMRHFGVEIGDQVTAIVGDARAERRKILRVVGRVVLPSMNDPNLPELGEGAGLTFSGVKELIPGAFKNLFLVRFTEDATPTQVEELLGRFPPFLVRQEAPRATDLSSLSKANNAPVVVSVVLAVLASATLAHGLLTSVRRRRRDLATLKTMGFRRRQLRAAVAWQASVLTVLAAAIAIPLGVVGARWSWRLFADLVGFVPEPVVPPLFLVVLVPAALVVGNLIAALPATSAARTQPAVVFRSE